MRIRIWLALFIGFLVTAMLAVVLTIGAPAGAAVVRAQAPPIADAAADDAAAAFAVAAPAVAEATFGTPASRDVVIDLDGLRAELASGTFTLPLPEGDTAVIGGGSFATVLGVEESEHWAVTAPESATSLTLTGHGVYGFATVDGRRVEIVPVANGVHVIFEDGRIDPGSALPAPLAFDGPATGPQPTRDNAPDRGGPALSLRELGLSATGLRLQAAPESVRVLVLVDQNVIAAWGGSGPALAQAAASINATNTTFTGAGINAQIDPRIREIAYTSSTLGDTAISRLRARYDGYFDQAHLMREAHEADLVMLLAKLTDYCGIANLPVGPITPLSDNRVFSVIDYGCIGPRHVIAHELGHNFGSLHDPDNAGTSTPAFPHSQGYVDPPNDFRTIMAYANTANGCTGCFRIPQFSSTTDTWMGHPTGTATQNNKLSINNMVGNAAALRPDTCANPPEDFIGAALDLGSAPSATGTSTTVCATGEVYELSFDAQRPVNSVWYEWTAPATASTRATTCQPETAIDTFLLMYEGTSDGTPDPLNWLDSDDDDFNCPYSTLTSTIDFTATAGTTYYFQLDGYGAIRGRISFMVTQDQCNGSFPTLAGNVVMGTSEDEIIMGTNVADTLSGLAGDDIFCGGGGNDTIYLGDGNDIAYGEGGNDLVYGGDGADFMVGGDGVDRMFGQLGADLLQGEAGDDRLYGGGGNDEIRGGPGVDRIYGQAGADNLFGEAGNDTIIGGVGNDTIRAGGGDDTVSGQAGDDVIWGWTGVDTIYGNTDDDTIHGEDDADQLFGQGGNDIITGGQGADSLYGGGGNDNLSGDSQNDNLYGQGGADTLTGGSGPSDYCHGGNGTDTASCETKINVP